MQIRPNRFDVGPILHQEVYQVPENCTTEQLGATLATKGAHLLIDTLKTLPERMLNKREQDTEGVTSAPKVNLSLSWIDWEEQTCDHIHRLFRAIGSWIPLRTIWMGQTVKLLDFVGRFNISLSGWLGGVQGRGAKEKAVCGGILQRLSSPELSEESLATSVTGGLFP